MTSMPGNTIPSPRPSQPARRRNFFRSHSLSLVTLGILLTWLLLYTQSDPAKHAGAFFGNAVADWSGTLVVIIASKYFFERGSKERLRLRGRMRNPLLNFMRCHSLSLFLIATGVGWLVLYAR